MGIVSAIPEKCKRCYACIRECPAKAIKVVSGQAFVIEERCIACGNCVKVCAQDAKRIEDSTADVRRMLAEDRTVFACLAPSFPAAFHPTAPGKIITGVRKLGFAQVWTVAFGAELVGREYAALFEESRRLGKPLITSPCPAVVAYVEKYMPSLRSALAPIVSPMIATARAIRYRLGGGVRIVFIGPCIAKKNEIRDPYVVGMVDSVLTFKELLTMFETAGIDLAALEESPFDGPRAHIGRCFPLSGGLLKTSGIRSDILDNDTVTTEGKDRSLAVLKELAEGTNHALLFDVLFCEGCINGPKMLNDLGMFARKEILANFIADEKWHVDAKELAAALDEFKDVHLARAFTQQNLVLPQPSQEDLERALHDMKKFAPEDQLNCGACGYPTCREKAIAVCQGLAEASMCLPYLVDELEDTCQQLQESHKELEAAQQRLLQSERLASMGQLSAGVAHEINNPLGTVLIYSHMLLRQIKEEDPTRVDLQMIVNEATRCKSIVRGLLDFARQSRVSKVPTDLARLIGEIEQIMTPRANAAKVRLANDVQPGLPTMMIDRDQIKQMLLNLVGNGIDAIVGKAGEVRIRAHQRPGDTNVIIEVMDTGVGIPEENLSKLFTPFFTTKEMGKGTGLGLAIAYGIVKMHSGDISAQSEEGKGTTFTISLPVETETPGEAAAAGVSA
jgi:signal transduction histidine kinase/NAD-dependent dihydropyrimidine dehydrogenase PreA subunit